MPEDKSLAEANPVDDLIVGLARSLRARGWRILFLPVVLACLLTAWSFTRPLQYTATVTLLPQEEQTGTGLLGQFFDPGILANSSGNLEPFYREIITSDTLLDSCLSMRFPISTEQSVSLPEIFNRDSVGDIPEDSLRAATELKEKIRRKVIAFNQDKSTGIMRLDCTLPRYPVLASQMANTLVRMLNNFTIMHRSRKAREQRCYIEDRVEQAKSDLDSFSNATAEFIEANRKYLESPILMQRFADLTRQSTAMATLWSELKGQLEAARIEENRNTSPVDVLEYARVPLKKSSPQRSRYFIAGFFLGFLLMPFSGLITGRFRSRFFLRGSA